MAINRFTGAIDNKWSTPANWSLGAIPTATDGHTTTFDGASPNCTVDASTRPCNNIDFTGYINTITMTNGVDVSGNVTLFPTMNVAGSGVLTINAVCTLNSNGYTWPNSLTTNGNITITLTVDFTVSGLYTNGAGANSTIWNTNTLNFAGSATINGTDIKGSSTVVFNGTGTWSGSGFIRNNTNVNTTGTLTITNTNYYEGTLTYIAGTVIATGTMGLGGGVAVILNCAGITWNNVALSGSITLQADLNMAGNCSGSVGSSTGVFNVNVGGNLTNNAGTGAIGFTFVMNGTGTWTSVLYCNLTINTTGTITFGSSCEFYNAKTLKYMAGTVITAGNTLTLSGGGSCVLDVNGSSSSSATTTSSTGINFNNVSFTSGILTLSSIMCVVGSFTTNVGACTINGSTSYLLGNLTLNQTLSGTTSLVFRGTGTWSGTSRLGVNASVDTPGTLTVSTAGVTFGNGKTLTYTAGTVVATSSSLTLGTGTFDTCTVATNGINWSSVSIGLLATVTFSNNFQCVNFTMPNTQTVNGSTIFVSGSWFSSAASGTSNVEMTGTGTVTMIATFSGSSGAAFTINSPSGAVTIAQTSVGGSVNNGTGINLFSRSFINTVGCANPGGFDVTMSGTANLSLNGFRAGNLSLATNSGIITLLSDAYCTNLFMGSQGFFSTINGFTIYCGGNFTVGDQAGTNTGTTKIVITGTNGGTSMIWFTQQTVGSSSFKNDLTIDVPGKVYIRGAVWNYNTGTLSIIRGTIIHLENTRLIVGASTTFVGVDKFRFKAVQITGASTITTDGFFQGTTSMICDVSAASASRIALTKPSYSHFVTASNCTMNSATAFRPVLTYAKANKGNNTGLIFGNNITNGFPQEKESTGGNNAKFFANGMNSWPNSY